MNTRRVTTMALLCAVALTIFVAEARIPVPIAGVKLGLANIITLYTMALLGKREAALVLTARIILGSMFSGSMSALIFSLAGGISAYAVMALTIGAFPPNLLWVVSIFGAIAHNAGQLTAAALITRTPGLFTYGLVLLIAAVITGAFTGVSAQYLIKALPLSKF